MCSAYISFRGSNSQYMGSVSDIKSTSSWLRAGEGVWCGSTAPCTRGRRRHTDHPASAYMHVFLFACAHAYMHTLYACDVCVIMIQTPDRTIMPTCALLIILRRKLNIFLGEGARSDGTTGCMEKGEVRMYGLTRCMHGFVHGFVHGHTC